MGSPKVTAVVCTYWPSRLENLSRILIDLENSTRPPDRVLVVNNNPSRTLQDRIHGRHLDIGLIEGWNTECRGKFIAALLDVADYYLLLDDDTSVGPETIQRLLDWSIEPTFHSTIARPGWVTGYLGCWIDWQGAQGPTLFSETSQRQGRLWPSDATAPTVCDTWCGCALWCDFQALANMVALEAKVRRPDRWPTEGDDVIIGLANHSVVLPLRGPECFVALPDGGQAMSTSIDDYYGMRDRFLRDVLKAQGRL